MRLRFALLLGFVALIGAAFALRHQLPTLLALVDGGPEPIAAVSLEAKITPLARPEPVPTQKSSTVEPQQEEAARPKRVSFPPRPASDTTPTVLLAAWTFSAPDLVVVEAPKATWRTSFGAERVHHGVSSAAAGFAADIIAISGIRDLQLLRRALPARHYFLLTPPQLLNFAMAQHRSRRPFPTPAVAVAIRRNTDVRVRRRLQTPLTSRTRSVIDDQLDPTPSDLKIAATPQTAPYAVEVLAHGSRFWVVVTEPGAPMPANLTRWIETARAKGDSVVLVAGPAAHGSKEEPNEEASKPPSPTQIISAGASPTDSGCAPPDLALNIWVGGKTDAPSSDIEALLRARPSGGDCVLLARLPVAVRQPRYAPEPGTDLDRRLEDELSELARSGRDDLDRALLLIRPDPVPRPETE